MIFMKSQVFYFLIYPWWTFVITGNGFLGNVIRYHILVSVNNFTYSYTLILTKRLFHRNSLIASLLSSTLAF